MSYLRALGHEHAEILARIRVLSDQIWEQSVQTPDIERWLANFDGRVLDEETEKLHALYLLSYFNYFGSREIRELLKSVYRDLFKYPIVQAVRAANNGTRDTALLGAEFNNELAATRFLGMGNPSESGSHLLYYFRQENKLSKQMFIHQHEILDAAPANPDARIAIPGLRRLVFIDDVLGSGTQAQQYSQRLLHYVRQAAARDGIEIEVWYFVLFAKPEGLQAARSVAGFDRVQAIHELDPAESAFHPDSRLFSNSQSALSLSIGQVIAAGYGELIFPGHGLGYRNGQLLLGLHHNIPDNTLPIFWCEETAVQWTPIFPRYNKVY